MRCEEPVKVQEFDLKINILTLKCNSISFYLLIS